VRKTEIRVESTDEFFERGRQLARLGDRGELIPSMRVVAFDEVESLLHVLTQQRVSLLRQLKETPASISDLARELKRDRSAVTRDVQILERFGVLRITERPLPGHGKQKWVTPIAHKIRLVAQL
jgi:predicted transcriptional regulator